jgi:hypothetical protein
MTLFQGRSKSFSLENRKHRGLPMKEEGRMDKSTVAYLSGRIALASFGLLPIICGKLSEIVHKRFESQFLIAAVAWQVLFCIAVFIAGGKA